ncbi:transport and Golgi organization protein 1 homolog [Erinaceus europaeus]|uniref:Transport and Golgi organization protein 1 homolog n=1 Tax=Erinaceus europaeus TaxID=9365 RepID=A0ABM3WCZ5_ERIEU|nr:transport and Golgi organization protein 1 homolog [Erinaceus europaeus]
MAAAAALLLCLLSLLGPPGRLRASRAPGLGRRFSESKLCADAECSMLMYRGEALEDFTGPDCRFVNFKKGDPIYVYHKLAGRSPEVWAGSVGRSFGYFPRSLIHVASQYTTEELKVPADETDFVCFDGGRDDFDSYDLEELLGYLNLEKTLGDGQHETEEPEASEEGDPETELLESTNSEESEFSEDTQEPKDRQEAQKNRPLENGQADPAQGERPPFESFKDMLQEKLRVPESENKTGSVSQASDEQKMDAYTRLKKDMTLDLKTKFGSTADVLVSDDETTSLVTSLEDDLDEESEAEYHVMAQEEEDDGQDSSEEPPLLTFTDGEDGKTPAGSGVEKFLAEQERTLKEELLVQVAPPLGIQKAEKDTLTAWEDPLDPTGVEWESSDSGGAKEGGDALAPGSKLSKPQPAPYDVLDSDKVSAAPEGAQVPERNEGKDPKVDTQSPPREGKTAEPPKKDLVQNGAGLEDTELESTLTPGSAQSTKLRSSPTSAREQPALQSGPGNTEDDPDGTVVHVSKETLDKEKPAMQPPEEDAGTGSAGRGEGSPAKEGKPAREPAGPADNQRNASRDILEGKEAAESGAEPHRPSEEQPSEDSEEEWLYRAQNQPRFSSPDGLHWQRESEEDSPGVGRNVSRHQERGEATGVNKQVEGKRLLGEEDSSEEELDSGRPVSDTHEVGATGQAEDTEVPDLQSEEEEYVPEELLEDENAVSAQQAQANSPEAQGSPLGAILQTPERAALGASHPASGIEASVPSGTERKGETGAGEADPQGKQVGHRVLTDEDGPLAAKEAPRPPEVSSSPDKKTSQVPEEGEASPSKDREPPQGLGPQEPLKAPGLTQKPGLRELLKESQQKLTDTESQGSTSEEQEDEQRHRTPPLASPKDSPIISSFFQNLQSRQRFQKYFDVPRLEALLQEMSSKLQATQRDSLPSNVEKALDKVFRASESHILIEAEKMLDARVTQKRDLGAKDSDIFEEAAVLEDIQDLIYFVRYQHSLAEGSAAPAVVQLPEEGWDQTLEETSPPLKENLPHVHIETVTTQTPEEEPRHLDQPVTWDTGLSEVPPQPSADPGPGGILLTE